MRYARASGFGDWIESYLEEIDIYDSPDPKCVTHRTPDLTIWSRVMVGRYELSDWQWQRIADLLPGKAGDRGRTAALARRVGVRPARFEFMSAEP